VICAYFRAELFKGDENERTAFDRCFCGHLPAAADLCSAENGDIHLNAQRLSGDRQEKYRK
jgi:hypothetical protein